MVTVWGRGQLGGVSLAAVRQWRRSGGAAMAAK